MRTLRWQPATSLVLSIIGLCVATYLTIAHFSTAVTLSCPAAGGAINCEKVTTSPQSYVFGIPVAVLGLVYFVPMVVLCLPAAWRSQDRRVHLARLGLGIAGIGMVIYLISAELFIIKAICLWCTSVHVITFLLFVLIVTTAPVMLGLEAGPLDDDRGPSDPAAESPRAG
jgi:uncharacterized membrane protein